MIVSLVGTNPVRIAEELAKLKKKTSADIERIDGEALDAASLFNIVSGATLFSENRFVVIKNLSHNTKVWETLLSNIHRVSDDTVLVLLDDKLDKRTKSYKQLQAVTKSIDVPALTDKQHGDAVEWTRLMAKKLNLQLHKPALFEQIVRRAYVSADRGYTIDQQKIMTVLKSMVGLPEVTEDTIETLMPPAPGESIFELIAIAAAGDSNRIARMVSSMKLADDPHRVFALLASQWTQLAMVAIGQGTSTRSIASELGIHPFVAGKMQQTARSFTRSQLVALTHLCADLDAKLKRSKIEPWDAVERMLIAVATKQ